MSGIQCALLVSGGNPGALSATMTTSASIGTNLQGAATQTGNGFTAGGALTSAAFPSGATIYALFDDTLNNRFGIAITDPTQQLQQNAFTQIVMNSLTFTTGTALTFIASGGGTSGVAIWKWSNSGVAVTGSGRTFAIT